MNTWWAIYTKWDSDYSTKQTIAKWTKLFEMNSNLHVLRAISDFEKTKILIIQIYKEDLKKNNFQIKIEFHLDMIL